MSNNKMKGLFKGLRYISQIIESEKDQDIQIGYPTDVKHVAHIGFDLHSTHSPSWMGEFKSPGYASAPLDANGDEVSEDGSNKTPRAQILHRKDVPEMPKSARRHLSRGGESPTDKKSSDKPKHAKHRTARTGGRDCAEGTKPHRRPKERQQDGLDGSKLRQHLHESSQGVGLGGDNPDMPRKSHRKRSTRTESKLKVESSGMESGCETMEDSGDEKGTSSRNSDC